MSTFATGKSLKLAQKLNPADSSLVANADVGTTNGGRLYFASGKQEEWIDFTSITNNGDGTYTYNGLTRGLSQTANPATAGVGKTWLATQQAILVAMHDQLLDKQKNTDFGGTTTAGLVVKSLTTAQRTALSGPNGAVVYDTNLGELYQYIGGAWSAVSAGSTQPNSSTTVAGKVQESTLAEGKAGTQTGGTGAELFLNPKDLSQIIQEGWWFYMVSSDLTDTYTATPTPALTSYVTGMKVLVKFTTANTGACTLNLSGLGAKSIKLIDGSDPLDGDIQANSINELIYDGTNFVLRSIAVRATQADVDTGTNTLKFVTPAQANNLWSLVPALNSYAPSSGDTLITTGIQFATGGLVTYSIAVSRGAVAGTTSCKVQYSPDNSSWVDVDSISVGGSASTSAVGTYMVRKGYYIRCYLYTSNSVPFGTSGVAASARLVSQDKL